MEIDWDSVQQILTLLVLFVAPAILNFLRGKKEEGEEEVENPFGKIEPPPAARPSHRRVSNTPALQVSNRSPSKEALGEEQKQERIKVEAASPSTSVPKYRAVGLRERQSALEVTRSSRGGKLGSLSRSQIRRAWLLKEVLEEPRAMKPF